MNVHLPEDLAARAEQAGLDLSALTQDALRRALGPQDTKTWLATSTEHDPSAIDHESALAALDAARDEAATQHG